MKLQPILENLTLGRVAHYANLSFVPVLGPNVIKDDLLLLDEALQTGYFTVTDSGDISALLVDNRLGMRVFVPSGAIVEGPTQNRASQLPVVVPARSKGIRLPVRCAEEGQPLSPGRRFSRSETILPASGRTGEVSQLGTWHTISFTMGSLKARNGTSDYSSAVRTADLSDYLRAVGPVADSQRGFIAAVGNGHEQCFYADILGSRRLYRHLHRSLVQSVAAVAKSKTRSTVPVETSKSEFTGFLTSVGQQELEEKQTDARLVGTVYLGRGASVVSALVCEGRPIQVSLRRDSTEQQATLRALDETIFLMPPL